MVEIDYDLQYAMEYNDINLKLEDISEVLAVVEGENDERDWHWVVKTNKGKLAYITGGCCYTGWDCQSWLDCTYFNAPLDLAAIIQDYYEEGVLDSLKEQLKTYKLKTWREVMDKKLGINNDTPRINI